MLSRPRLAAMLAKIPGLTVALVGDLFLDRYLELAPGVEEFSIETGLEAYQVATIRNSPGALGTVMNNLAALGVGRLLPVTVIGADGHGYDLLRSMRTLPVDPAHVLQDAQRQTPTYTKPLRPLADGSAQELNRLDVRNRQPMSAATTRELCDHLHRAWAAADGLIVLDQICEENWGVVNEQVRDTLVDLHREFPDKLLYVDSRAHLGRFACGMLKGNRGELLAATGLPADSDARTAAECLARRQNLTVFATVGAEGILAVRPDGATVVSAGLAAAGPLDIVGAGDAATSGIVSALLCGASLEEAADLGNLAASITVQQLGTTGTATPAQVLARHAQWEAGAELLPVT